MYADKMTRSMKEAAEETDRRRKIQEEYNKKHNITPQQIEKKIHEKEMARSDKKIIDEFDEIPLALLAETTNIKKLIADYTKEMKKAAQELDFQKAQRLKNMIAKLKKYQ